MTTLPERLLAEASFWSDWPKDGGDIYVRPDGAADMGKLLREAAAALQAAPDGRDTARLDWLEMQAVEVSKNLRYGCTRLFLCGPLEDEGEYEPSHLRACIDAYLAAPSPTAAQQAGEK